MSRYIDRNELLKTINENVAEAHNERCSQLLEAILNAPTADVVEVVRCKDCKHHPDNGGECDRSITHTSRDYVCEVNTYRYIGLDYCSYGERKENGT